MDKEQERGGETPPAIETAGLCKRFGTVEAVADLTLRVDSGTLFGLVGPDGAGKSTAIRLLCGLLRPDGGSARVLGLELPRESEAVKRRIGYLSQNFTLYGDLTVDENIEFFARIHGVRDIVKRRTELLNFTRLHPFRTRLAQDLSGGMKKKLALACTLIHTPDLILLDEPSTGVDPVSRGEFWNILSSVLDQGVTVLLTSPYLDEADRCHRVALMYGGRVVQSGTPDEIKASMPGALYEIACPDPASAYRVLREQWSATQVVLLGDRLRVHCNDEQDLRRLRERSARPDIRATRVEPIEAGLEDAFVALVERMETEERSA